MQNYAVAGRLEIGLPTNHRKQEPGFPKVFNEDVRRIKRENFLRERRLLQNKEELRLYIRYSQHGLSKNNEARHA